MEKTDVLLTLDPATSTGFCLTKLFSTEEGYVRASIYEYGFIDVDCSSEYQGDHCISLMAKLEEMIATHTVTHIAIEDYFFSKKFASGCNANAAFRTAIHILSRSKGIPYTILGISAWKSYVAGKSTPLKEQKKKWGAEAAKKLYIQQALWERNGFRFPNHSISSKSGRPIQFRLDIVDSVAQTVYFCGMLRRVPNKNITLDVEIPDDIVFAKPSKKIFIYPESAGVKVALVPPKKERKRKSDTVKKIKVSKAQNTIRQRDMKIKKKTDRTKTKEVLLDLDDL
jgi:Holliday junction resolvasome RuvABC endonuclease subunit